MGCHHAALRSQHQQIASERFGAWHHTQDCLKLSIQCVIHRGVLRFNLYSECLVQENTNTPNITCKHLSHKLKHNYVKAEGVNFQFWFTLVLKFENGFYIIFFSVFTHSVPILQMVNTLNK